MNGGTEIALPARSVRYAVCEAMGSAVPEGFRPQPPARATSAAGADVAEGVAVDGVAADPAVFDTDAAPSYRDRVKHDGESLRLTPQVETAAANYQASSFLRCAECGKLVRVARGSGLPKECPYCHTYHVGFSLEASRPEWNEIAATEVARRARLSRWQETRG